MTMESQAPLDIQVLGVFRVTYQGQPVRSVLTRRLEALLAYLLLHRHEPVPRQRLAFLFWPDASEAQARTNLRRLLHQLREAFPSISDYVQAEPAHLAWNQAAAYRLDLAEFETAARQARNMAGLRTAIELYRGDLLPDLYEDWVLAERERLGRVYEGLLATLIKLEEEREGYAEAIQAAQQLLQRDGLREETYRVLMRLHAKNGDRPGVRRAYDTCRAVLQRELAVEPEADTEAAYRKWFEPGHAAGQKADQPATREPRRRAKLPAPLEAMIGRGEALEQVKALVREKRLATLTGFGGVGKTRLALAAAEALRADFENQVGWIDLAPVNDTRLLPQVFADGLGVRDESGGARVERLIDFIGDRPMLLVVDNCEHVLAAAGHLVEQLLKACAALHVLATSRISLRILGESAYPVQPLATPALETDADEGQLPGLEALQATPSVRLFVERARAILPTFALRASNQKAVAQICRQLDGIPLALELAAGRIRLLDPQAIATRLDQAFHLLSGGKHALPRHQTLRATLDWSCALLPPEEQRLLRRLAVFAGGFRLEDAEAVTEGEGLARLEVLERLAGLIDHSLVASDEAEGERHYRLHEVTRQYALERLTAAGEAETYRTRHLSHFCQLAERAEPFLRGQEQVEWLGRLDRETGNLRAALEWGVQQQTKDSLEWTLRLGGALWVYWFMRGRFAEGLGWMEQILSSAEAVVNQPRALGKALYTAASFAAFMGNNESAAAYTEASLRACEQAQDLAGRAVSLHHLGLIALNRNDPQAAEQYYREGLELSQQIEDDWLEGVFLVDLAIKGMTTGETQAARDLLLRSLTVSRQAGDRFGMLYALTNLASLALDAGDLEQAERLSQESFGLSREIGEIRGMAFSRQTQAYAASKQGRWDEARKLWLESLAIFWECRDMPQTLDVVEDLAISPLFQGVAARAVRLLAASQSLRQKTDQPSQSPRLPREVALRLEQLRTELGDAVFDQAWTQGQTLSLEQMVHQARE